MRKLISILFLSALAFNVLATHNRAGEITYVQISDFTYEVTITTFTYTQSLADRPLLDILWGDNTVSTAPRVDSISLPNFYRKNIYKLKHTYPGPGVYRIVVQDPNRNYGVKNIPNSVNVVFSISTILTVNPAMGRNSTPVLLNPPYDKAALGYIFIHNPGAFDPDGDSLSYQLTVCTREDGKTIANYTLPPATDYIKVDSITGDLIWNTPAETGKYNVAMEIQEWRNGKKIGTVVRDMQIEVYDTKNKPPVNTPIPDICVEVGQPVSLVFSATDPNNDLLSLTSTSGIYNITACRATLTGIDSLPGSASSRIEWIPCHEAVRHQPYNIIIKSDDNNSEVRLADIDNFNIKVLGPSPVIQNAAPQSRNIRVTWNNYGTNFISGFAIYRREGPSTLVIDSCTDGIPVTAGFVKVGFAPGSSTTFFIDSDNGAGLQYGQEYTYRIVAVYPNGTESKASNEITSALVSGLPIIRNVSVTSTNPATGSVYLAWMKPQRLDTIPGAVGPYEFRIFRSDGINGTNFSLVNTIATVDLNDTTYTDNPINTTASGYLYKIELWNVTSGNIFLIGEPGYASSVFATVSPGDRKARFLITRNVPWINTRYDIFRFNNTTTSWDSVGTSAQLTFTDNGLVNGTNYCYRIRAVGGYLSEGLPKNLINFSQEVCVTPVDNEPPCIPPLRVQSQCDSLYNTLTWSITDPDCFADLAGFRIWFKPSLEGLLQEIEEINNKNTTSTIHRPGDLIAGCYAISTFDALGNESEVSGLVCVDSCNFFEIPNVFTPNDDGRNDRLVAKASGLVEKLDFKLFNRGGLLIFSTDNPRIDWDGTYKGKIVSPGVYFYHCEVFERRISGLEQFQVSGFVHVITELGAEVNTIETK